MRIGPTSSIAATGDTQAVGRAPRSAALEAGDAVQVSPSVGALGQVATRNQAERTERIAKLKAAIGNGTYQVDRQALAGRIADEESARARSGA